MHSNMGLGISNNISPAGSGGDTVSYALTNDWIQISTTGAVVRKGGNTCAAFVYKQTEPADDDDRFILKHNNLHKFEDVGLPLWARTCGASTTLTVNPN